MLSIRPAAHHSADTGSFENEWKWSNLQFQFSSITPWYFTWIHLTDLILWHFPFQICESLIFFFINWSYLMGWKRKKIPFKAASPSAAMFLELQANKGWHSDTQVGIYPQQPAEPATKQALSATNLIGFSWHGQSWLGQTPIFTSQISVWQKWMGPPDLPYVLRSVTSSSQSVTRMPTLSSP